MAQKQDDGRRGMPKLKCPYGNHRFADVPDVALRNESFLVKLDEAQNPNYIMECPICHQKVALNIRALNQKGYVPVFSSMKTIEI